MAKKSSRKRKKRIPWYLRNLGVCCPRCLSVMVVRRTKSGFFFGCPGFPWCKGTRTTEKALRCCEFRSHLSRYVQPPLGGDEILLNPDAPSFVWYEVHDLRVNAKDATIRTLAEPTEKASGQSRKLLQELAEVAT